MSMILPIPPAYPGLPERTIIIDEDDWERVRKHTWSVFTDGKGTLRCVTRVHPYAFLLNRFIMRVLDDKSVHVLARNGNYLDCRKENLVVVPARGWNRLPKAW